MYNRTILITGGTGSWGKELVSQLLQQHPKEIRIFSRNEANQVAMKQTFNADNRLNFIIGDIRDKAELEKASEGVDLVYHLAALKHVPICEYQPLEALKTNVEGTQNVIDAAINNNVDKVVYVSTDKAANPSNFYGMTKAIGEKLTIGANLQTDKTRFVCIRGGNVLGTNGSVIHVFKHFIKHHQEIRLTDWEMTRFFLTVQDAIKLLFKATKESIGGEIFVMKMPSCQITDLANVLIDMFSDGDVDMKEVGTRPGEKLHEILLSQYESQHTIYFDKDYYVILPTIDIAGIEEHYANYPTINMTSYSSKDSLMTKQQIKKLLEKGGFDK